MIDATGPVSSIVTTKKSAAAIVLTLTLEEHTRLTAGKRIQPAMSKAVKAHNEIMPISYTRFLDELREVYQLELVADWPLASIDARCLVFTTAGENPVEPIVKSLSRDPRIEIAQSLNIFSTLASNYDDPLVHLQHGLQSMQVERTHQWATGNSVTVGIIDTGVDIDHPELKDRVTLARNFVDQNSIAFRNDVHGTAVAAIVGAKANNAIGMVGIAPDAQILALKGCWYSDNSTRHAMCNSFTLAKSIDFAITQNVDILNLSLAGPPDPLLEWLLETAMDNGVIVVGAFDKNSPDSFPTNVDGVLAVSMSGVKNEPSSADVITTLVAPGVKILSAKPNGGYDYFSGSSISTAHVTGLVALLRERQPKIRHHKVLSILQDASAVDDSSSNKNPVNACRAVTEAMGTGKCSEEILN